MRTHFVLCVVILFGAAGDSAAQQPGDKVIAKDKTALRVGNRIVESVPADGVLTVEKVQGGWIWAKSPSGNAGWIQTGEVLLAAPDAPDTPTSGEMPLDRGDQRVLVGGTGTAFVVHPDGYLLTNAHVIRGDQSLRVESSRVEVVLGERLYLAQIVAVDAERDLAILKVEAQELPSLPLGNSDGIRLGEEIRAIGFPLGLALGTTAKVTRGTVSGIEKTPLGKQIQTDTTINPGNSGGPVVNASGEVIGIATAKIVRADVENIGICVPINDARQLLDKAGAKHQASIGTEKAEPVELIHRVLPAVALVKNTPLLWSIAAHKEKVSDVEIAPNQAVFGTAAKDEICLWSASTGALQERMEVENLFGFDFFPDGKRLAVGKSNRVIVWDIGQRKALSDFELSGVTELLALRDFVSKLDVSPDGTMIATAGKAATRLWRPDGQAMHVIQHEGTPEDHLHRRIEHLEFSPDSRELLLVAGDVASFIDVKTGKVVRTIPDVQATYAGDKLIITGRNTEPGTFDSLGRRLTTFPESLARNFSVRRPAISRDGRYVVAGSAYAGSATGGIAIVDPGSGKKIFQSWDRGGFPAHPHAVSAVAISNDGSTVLTGHDDGSIRSWKWQEQAARLPVVTAVLSQHPLKNSAVAWSPTAEHVVYVRAGDSGQPNKSLPVELVMVDSQSGKVSRTLSVAQQDTLAVAYSRDGRYFAAGGELLSERGKSQIAVFHTDSWEPWRDWSLECQKLTAVEFSPDGQRLAVLVDRGDSVDMELWDVETRKRIKTFSRAGGQRQWSLTCSHDGKRLAAGTTIGEVTVWDHETGRSTVLECQGECRGLAFSPDDQWLACAVSVAPQGHVDRSRLILWNAVTGELKNEFPVAYRSHYGVSFNRQGNRLLAISDHLAIWNTETWQLVSQYEGQNAQRIAFTRDGETALWFSQEEIHRVSLE